MASGETELNFRVQVQGLNQLGQLRSSVMKLSGGTKRLVDSSMALGNAFPKLEGAAKDLQKIYFGQAQTMKQLVRNQKIFKNTIKAETGFMRAARKETKFGSNAWRAYTAEMIRARKQMSSLPLRKLGTDLRNVADTMLRRGKDLQWIGRQMIVGISAPLGLMMRSALQSFEAFEKQFVRTRKILGLSETAARSFSKTMLEISTRMGASRSIVAGLTSDFAQMGTKLLGGTGELQDVAAQYSELTLQLEHVGQVSAGVGRDFIANIAGLIKGSAEGAEKIAAVRGQLAKFNMVENITALALKDLAEAFPQVSPAARAVGIELTFLAGVIGQMKELGLNATESAHALKFALQRMINPTTKVKNLSAEYAATIKDFNQDLGIGNELLFNLAENMQLISKEAGGKEAIIWLGELVGKRQASRIYALVSNMDSLQVSIEQIGEELNRATSKANMKGWQNLGSQVTEGVESLDELKAKFQEVFAEDDSVQKFVDQFQISNEMGELESDMPVFIELLSGLSPPLKALVIDYIGATAAGKVFAQELEIVMGGPAMMMQKTRNDVKNLLQEFGAAFYYTIQNIIPHIQEFLQWLQQLSPRVKFVIVAMGGLLAVLGPVAFIFGQLTNAFASVTKAAAFLLPKMKDFTRSLFLAKSLAGEKLPLLRRLGAGFAVVGKQARKAGEDLGGYGTRAMKVIRAIRQDPSVGMTGFADAVPGGAVKGVGSIAGSKGVAKALDAAMATAGVTDVDDLPDRVKHDVLRAFHQVGKANEEAATKSVGRIRGLFRNTNSQFDQMGNKIKSKYKGVLGQIEKAWKFTKKLSRADVGPGKPHKRPALLGIKGKPGFRPDERFASPKVMVDRWKQNIEGLTKHIKGKFANAFDKVRISSIREAWKTKGGWKAALGGIWKGIKGGGKGAFKLVKIHGVLSAMVIGTAFKTAGMVMKLAMIGSGVGIFLVALGGIIMFIKTNLDKFKEAGKGAFTTLRIAFATLKEALLEVGNIFFSVFEDVFGGGGDEAADGAEDNMSAISGAMQGVADIALKMSLIFKKVVTYIAATLFPIFLNAAKVAFTAIGTALGWLGENWRAIAQIVLEVVHQIIVILEYLVDSALTVINILLQGLRVLVRAFFGLLQPISSIVAVLADVLNILLEVALFVIRTIITGFFKLARNMKGTIGFIVTNVNRLIDALNKVPGVNIGKIEFDIDDTLDTMENAANVALDAFDKGKDAANEYIHNDLPGVVKRIGGVIDSTFGTVQSGIATAIDFGAAEMADGFLNAMLNKDHDLGEAAKLPVKEGVEDGVEEGAEESDMSQLSDSVADAVAEGLRKAVNEWVGKFKTATQDLMSEVISLATADFEAKAKIFLSAYDSRVKAIQDTIAAEKALTKTIQYENERRAIINRMALDKENFIRSRALAIYEGRIEDARNLSVKFAVTSDTSTEKIGNIDSKRAADMLAETRRLMVEEINDTKAHHAELIEIKRRALATSFEELKKHLPQNAAQWEEFVVGVEALVDGSIADLFGEGAANATTIEGFATEADRVLREKFSGLFGSGGVIDTQVTRVNPVIETETSKWSNTVTAFKTNAESIFTAMFDEIERQWIEDLNWEIIAIAWGEGLFGEGGLMETVLPLLTQLDELKNGVQEVWDDIMGIFDPEEGTTNPELNFARKFDSGSGGAGYYDPHTGQYRAASSAGRSGGAGGRADMAAGITTLSPADVRNMIFEQIYSELGSGSAWTGGPVVEGPGRNRQQDRYDPFARFGDYTGNKPIERTGNWDMAEAARDIGANFAIGASAYWNLNPMFSPIDTAKSVGSGVAGAASGIWGGLTGFGSFLTRDSSDTPLGRLLGWSNGGLIKAQYGRYLGGFQSSMIPIAAHGGEYVMSARAVQNIGLSRLESMNHTKNYQGGGGGGTNIFVENFIGEPEWFEGMMGDYNVNVAPKNERSRGLESRKISSMADNNRRGRV